MKEKLTKRQARGQIQAGKRERGRTRKLMYVHIGSCSRISHYLDDICSGRHPKSSERRFNALIDFEVFRCVCVFFLNSYMTDLLTPILSLYFV